MKSKIILFVFSFLVWSILSWNLDWQHIVVGIIASLVVSFFTGDLFTRNPHKFRQPRRYLWFVYYVPVFIWEMIKANIDLAYRIIHPNLPIKPGIVKVKTNLKSETGLTFLANSITLKPGTTAVDVDRENGYIYVHWINVRDRNSEKATELITKRLEKVLERIFE